VSRDLHGTRAYAPALSALGSSRSQPEGRAALLAAGTLVVGSSLLYGYTVAPTLLWGDDAMFQRVLATGSLTNHPIWVILSRLFARLPWGGDLALRANLASAAWAVGAVAFLALAVWELAPDVRAAVSAGAILAVSHTFWLEAVRAEVYTLHMLFFFAGLWAFLRWRRAPRRLWWLLLGLLLWWLGTVNHLLLIMSFPGGLVLVLSAFPSSQRQRALLFSLLALAVGAVLFVWLVPNFAAIILGAVRDVLYNTPLSLSPRRIAMHLVIFAYQFPLVGWLAVPGARELWRRDRAAALALGLVMVLTAGFAVSFGSLESYVFHLPVFGLIALLAGLGVSVVAGHRPWQHWLFAGLALIALQVGLYRVTPLVVDRFAPGIMPSRDLPGRQASTFFLWPPKRGYYGARVFAETTMDVLPPNAVLITDWTPSAPLRYLQDVEGRRPDVLLLQVDSLLMRTVDQYVGQRPIFLANADPAYYPMEDLETAFRLQPFGPVYALVPRRGAP